MKKAKLIGILMASILAVAPVTNFTESALSFDNAIVAEAVSRTGYVINKSTTQRVFKFSSATNYYEIMQSPNGQYHFYLMKDGNLTISNRAYKSNDCYNHRYDIWWSD